MHDRKVSLRASLLTGAVLAALGGCSRFQTHRSSPATSLPEEEVSLRPRLIDYSRKAGPPTAVVTKVSVPPIQAVTATTTTPVTARVTPPFPPPRLTVENYLEDLPSISPEKVRLPVAVPIVKNAASPTLPTGILPPTPPEKKEPVSRNAITPVAAFRDAPAAPAPREKARGTPRVSPPMPVAAAASPVKPPVVVAPLPREAPVKIAVSPKTPAPETNKFEPLAALPDVPTMLPEPITVAPLPVIPLPPVDPNLAPLAARPDIVAIAEDVKPRSKPAVASREPLPEADETPLPGGNKFDTTPGSPLPTPAPISRPHSHASALGPVTPQPRDGAAAETVVPIDGNTATGPLGLTEAVALAHRLQPRLRVFLESIVQAEGNETVAHAPFFPTAAVGVSAGGYDLNVGGNGTATGAGGPNFNFVPGGGALPVGLNMGSGYELAELKVQWLLTDFGRRLGRYRQAQIGVDIASLQTDRAHQTVANEVAVAFHQVLRTRALQKTTEDAVKRAEADLEVIRKLQRGGIVEREKVLRAEVQLSQTQRSLDAIEAAAANAVSALNLAIGLNVNAPTEVLGDGVAPEFRMSLADCLQEAVNRRRELEVAQRSVQIAQEGVKVAKADFKPRVVADGRLYDFQQGGPRGNADLAVGAIKLEWGLFEGGRRIGELRIADSKVRAAAAQAEAMADTIAFQVTEAYRMLIAAHRGIERAKPALEQARETYRLTHARLLQGDATPADATDAENVLTRAEQDFQNSTYDYLIALTRLHFAIGLPPAADCATNVKRR